MGQRMGPTDVRHETSFAAIDDLQHLSGNAARCLLEPLKRATEAGCMHI